jgi:hypothetical protein
MVKLEAAMKKRGRRIGRPRKRKGSVTLKQFSRAAQVMYTYDQARARGEKHDAAVAEAVDWVKQHRTEMRVSERGVKRILSTYRPRRGRRLLLLFEPKVITEEALKKHRWALEKCRPGKKILESQVPVEKLTEKRSVMLLRLGVRPKYPRSNRKKNDDLLTSRQVSQPAK